MHYFIIQNGNSVTQFENRQNQFLADLKNILYIVTANKHLKVH